MLGRGASRHAEAMVGEHLAGTGDVAHDAVEDTPPVSVLVHAELEEVAQKTPAPRDAKGERVADAGIASPRALGDHRVRRAAAVCLVRSCLCRTRG